MTLPLRTYQQDHSRPEDQAEVFADLDWERDQEYRARTTHSKGRKPVNLSAKIEEYLRYF